MDKWTDAGWTDRKMILLSHTLFMRESDTANLAEFCLVV